MNLDHLNKEQKDAVLQTDGAMMILAGAGAGKTRTLVSKIIYLLSEKNIGAYQLLALTFSNKATQEMRDRITCEVPFDIGGLQVLTFHSFCANLLRQEFQYLGLSKNFVIYDTSDQKSLVKKIMKRRGISQKETSPFEIIYFIENLKNYGHYRNRNLSELDYEIDSNDPFYEIYLEYEMELHKANSTDFGGLIVGVIELFEKFPKILVRYQDRFKYVLIDEYQDTNRAQFDLMVKLAPEGKNICVVGDEDQSIYSWRGADIRNILDFEQKYKNAKILKLEQNYRSSKNIIEAAGNVISNNTERKGKKIWTENPQGDCIEIIECFDDRKEAEFVATKIKLLKEKSCDYNEMAVFYRTNSQARVIEDYLRKERIPYQVIGGMKFYERKEIKDILAYMRVIVNKQDSLALSRIINIPSRGLGATTLRKIEEEAIKTQSSLLETFQRISDFPDDFKHIRLTARMKSSISCLMNVINEVSLADEKKESLHSIYEKILYETGYYEMLKLSKDYESKGRIENLGELGNAIIQFEEIDLGKDVSSFLETITLNQSFDEKEEQENKVSLMTIHGAKGLEFHYVWVTGVEENVFPSYQSIEDGGEAGIEEERRLFYVAMTRAMKKLYLSFAQGRMLFGQVRYNGHSRFIQEIPEEYYQWENFREQKVKENNSSSDWDCVDEEYEIPISRVEIKSEFIKGKNISHGLYGEGVILSSEGSLGNERVTILFNDGARKKFLAKLSPLKVL